MTMLALILVVVAATLQIQAAPLETLKLKFKISGRDLADKDDIGMSDPFLEIFFTEDGNKEETKIGATSVLLDELNPNWGEVFEFEFIRSKKQRFVIRLYDDDPISDDNLGHAYIDVAEFVDKEQHLTANLNKKGYIILQTVIPVVTPAPDKLVPPPTPSPIKKDAPLQTLPKNNTFAQLNKTPATFDASKPLKLKFKLSAHNLLNKDTLGESDPFAEISFTDRQNSKQTKLGMTKVIDDDPNPVWSKDIFEFNYDPAKSQKWHFEVKDSDFGDSDGLGKAELSVQDYVLKGQKITINLSKQQGTLTIEAQVPPTPTQGTSESTKNVYQPPPTIIPSAPPTKATPPPTKAPTPPPIIKLRFQLSARGLDSRDILSKSDPYVKVYYQEGSEKELFIKNTQKFENKEDADWPDVFEISYDPKKSFKLRFLVLDEDDSAKDDELGNVSLDVSEYVKNNENITLKLNKGTLTISKY